MRLGVIALAVGIVSLLGSACGSSSKTSDKTFLSLDGITLIAAGEGETIISTCSIENHAKSYPQLVWIGYPASKPNEAGYTLSIAWQGEDPFTLPENSAGISIETPDLYKKWRLAADNISGGTSVKITRDGDWFTAEGTLMQTYRSTDESKPPSSLHQYKFTARCANINLPKEPDAVDKANPPVTSRCGDVHFPETGATATVVVAAGNVSCGDAMTVFQKFLTDHSLEHSGNTWSAEFDGWSCAIPTAIAAESDGYVGQCTKEAAEIRALPLGR